MLLFYLIKGRRRKALIYEAITRSRDDDPGSQRQWLLYRLSNLIASEGERWVSDLSHQNSCPLETHETEVMPGSSQVSLWAGPATLAPQQTWPKKRSKPCSALFLCITILPFERNSTWDNNPAYLVLVLVQKLLFLIQKDLEVSNQSLRFSI